MSEGRILRARAYEMRLPGGNRATSSAKKPTSTTTNTRARNRLSGQSLGQYSGNLFPELCFDNLASAGKYLPVALTCTRPAGVEIPSTYLRLLPCNSSTREVEKK